MVARHGLREAGRKAVRAARKGIRLREEHVWYELQLAAEAAAPALPAGATLVEASGADVDLLDELPSVSPEAARKLRVRGSRLFLVLEERRPLFACWIHTGATPALAAPGGWLPLPDGTVCLEDSVTAPAARGRGIAPAAWSELAHRLAAEGAAAMITKVEVVNAASRKAVEKAGFREFARMRLSRVVGRSTVELEGGSPLAADLRARLGA